VCRADSPYDQLGSDEWSKDQLDGVRQYVAACLQGEERAAEQIAGEDAEMREGAQDDPNQADVIEQTQNGIWGWSMTSLRSCRLGGLTAATSAPNRALVRPE
jgi:hypothetical protein